MKTHLQGAVAFAVLAYALARPAWASEAGAAADQTLSRDLKGAATSETENSATRSGDREGTLVAEATPGAPAPAAARAAQPMIAQASEPEFDNIENVVVTA